MSNIRLKVQYKDLKFYHVVSNSQLTFAELVKELATKIKEQGESADENLLECCDPDQFSYVGSDQVMSLLSNNSQITLKAKLQPPAQQQQPDPKQQEKQNAPEEKEPEEKKQSSGPVEAIVVVYDVSGSMDDKTFFDQFLTKRGAVNAYFSAFADKTMAFELNHLVQLIVFDSKVVAKCDFINDFNTFIQLVDNVNTGGSTRLYDALKQAVENLVQLKQKYPNIIPRIIALTDGQDNSSHITAQKAAMLILKNKIILDSFVVESFCSGLKNITLASGGRCYCPQSLNQGLELFEIETILSVSKRGELKYPEVTGQVDLSQYESVGFYTEGLKVQAPQFQKQSVDKPEVMLQKLEQQNKQNGLQGATKRIMTEIQQLVQNPIPNIKIFPLQQDISKWKILLIGPEGTPYQHGVFQIAFNLPSNFPFSAPQIQFVTEIYHCQFSKNGSSCLGDEVTGNWSPAKKVRDCLEGLLNVLKNPNKEYSLDSNIASEMLQTPDIYKKKAIENTKAKANQSIDELLTLILGEDAHNNEADYNEKKKELQEWIAKYKKA